LELWFTLLVLYGAQCLVRLSESEVLFVRPFGRWRAVSGPGWRLTHLFSDEAAVLANRLPLILDGEDLYARERPVRFGLSAPSSASARVRGPAFTERDARSVEQRGHLVRVGGQLFHRSATRRGAAALACLLRDLAGASSQQVAARLRTEVGNALSVDEFESRRARLVDATRTLAWSTHVYRLLLVAGLPFATWLLGEEPGLLTAFPVLAMTHVFALFFMLRAHRKLFPGDGDQRFEDVATAAIYPPALLRAHANMRLEVLSCFHPAVHAACRLVGEHRRTFLRAELARLDLALEMDGSPVTASLERDALIEFLKGCGETRESLFKARLEPGGPSQGSYCPVCSSDYLRNSGRCIDCGATLIAY
jgi:hypothetical protein